MTSCSIRWSHACSRSRRAAACCPRRRPVSTSPACRSSFISILAQAQKAVSAGAIERFWQFSAQIGAIKPEALDRLDADGTMDAYADITGVPAQTVVPLADARKVRQARTQAQARQNQLAAAERIAAIGKTASAIDVGGGQNAVSAMLGGGR